MTAGCLNPALYYHIIWIEITMNNFKSGMTAGLSQRSTKQPSQAKECAVAIRSSRKKPSRKTGCRTTGGSRSLFYGFFTTVAYEVPIITHSFNLSLNHSWHAEQLLFYLYAQNSLTLSLNLNLTLSLFLTLTLSLFLTLTLFQSLNQSLSTCWTSFVFISMLKIRCL